MSATQEKMASPDQYSLISVEKTETPDGMEGDNWHCYIIQRGTSVLTGKKPGSMKLVTEHAKQVVSDLNSRTGKYCGSFYTSRKKQ